MFLFDGVHCHGFGFDFDGSRMIHVCTAQSADFPGDGGGEKKGGAIWGKGADDPANLTNKAHVHHPVHFIQYQKANVFCDQVFMLDVIINSAGSAGNHGNGTFKSLNFLIHVVLAVYCRGTVRKMACHFFQVVVHLNRQFPCRFQYKTLGPRLFRIGHLQKGYPKNSRFSAAGLGHDNHILPAQYMGDRFLLYLRGLFETHPVQSF